jgi:hypothetical protein
MIAFGCPIIAPDIYERWAEPGIRFAAEPDSPVFAYRAASSIFRSYNLLLEKAGALDDLEALVLVHQDTEIVDTDFCDRVRAALSDPGVGVAGCVGAVGVRSIAWWEGSVTLSSFANRYEDHGGGELRGFSWDLDDAPPYTQVGEVDTLDGFLLALSPWTVRNVRFDEQLIDFHGYDLDFCLQVREAGRRVTTADLHAVHHRPLEMLPDVEPWVEAHMRVAEKWDGRMPGIGTAPGSWQERALRAEAERDAARAIAHTKGLELQARRLQVERALTDARGSISWRLTAPFRLLAR